MTAANLADQFGMSLSEGEEFYSKYKKSLPTLFSWEDRTKRRCKKEGTAYTYFGRPRRVSYYFQNGQAGFGYRTIINTIIQGCLDYNSRVLTNKGYIRIGDLYTSFLSNSEEFVSEYRVWNGFKWCEFSPLYRGTDTMYELEMSNGQKFKMDSRHGVKVIVNDKIEWKNTKDIVSGDLVCFSKLQNHEVGEYVESIVGLKGSKLYREDMVFNREDIRFMIYLFGLVLGDGHIDVEYKRMSLCFGEGKYYIIEVIQEFCKKHGINVRVTEKGHTLPSGVYSVRKTVNVDCTPLINGICSLVGLEDTENCYTKRLPDKTFTLDRELRGLLLKGLYDTDGTKKTGGFHFANEGLVRDLQLFIRLYGYSTYIFNTSKEDSSKVSWGLNVHQKEMGFVDELNSLEVYESVCSDSRLYYQTSITEYHVRVLREYKQENSVRSLLSQPEYVIFQGIRSGTRNSCELDTFRSIVGKLGIDDFEDYDFYEVRDCTNLGFDEDTYTLMVNDDYHQFDSEGIISKNTASDILKIAFMKLWKRVLNHESYRDRVRFVTTVHDEIDFAVHKSVLEEVLPIIIDCMKFTTPEWKVDLDVEASIGMSWGDTFPIEYSKEKGCWVPTTV